MANQWYPFFPGDYARDTGHLSDFEDLCYRRLLDYYYSTGEPLPSDEERLKRVCKAFSQEQQGAVVYVLGAFFKESSGGFRNDKADRVIAKAAEVSEKRAEAARKSHERRGKPPEPPKPAIAPIKPAIAPKNDANGGAKTVHPQPQPQPQPQVKPPPPIREGMPKTEKLLREMVEEKREFIRANFGLDDGEINIHLEEMVVKTRDRPPGPDLWLYASRFLLNRKDDINGKQQRIASGTGPVRGKENGTGRIAQGPSGGGLSPGQVQGGGGIAFEDRSDEWGAGEQVPGTPL